MAKTNPTLYCLKCGYNLTGNTTNNCPECGLAFDPACLEADITKLAGLKASHVFLQVFIPAIVLAVVMVVTLSVGILGNASNEEYVAAIFLVLGTPPVIYLIYNNWKFTRRLVLRYMTRSQTALTQNRLRFFRVMCCAVLLLGQAVLGVLLIAAGCFGVCMVVLGSGGLIH